MKTIQCPLYVKPLFFYIANFFIVFFYWGKKKYNTTYMRLLKDNRQPVTN
jgi:hypothetical protein